MENKKDILKTLLVFLIIGVILFIVYKLVFNKYDYNIYFLNSIESDAIIIKGKNSNILIDTAEEKDSANLSLKLAELGIKEIDYLILSHPDKDHIGNASFIINNFQVKNVIETSFDKGSTLHEEFKKDLSLQPNINHLVLTNDYNFEIDNMSFEIIAPNEMNYTNDNDYSLVTYLTIGDIKFMFTGDIMQMRIDELLKKELETVDVYKIPHHGRYNSLSIDLIENVSPKHAVSTGNTDSEITNYLTSNNINYYNTQNGIVHFSTDGEKLKIIK